MFRLLHLEHPFQLTRLLQFLSVFVHLFHHGAIHAHLHAPFERTNLSSSLLRLPTKL